MNYQALTFVRKSRGLTHENMSNLLGYKDKSSYCLIENGKVKMTVETMNKIIDILQLSEEEIKEIFFNNSVEETQTFTA